MTMSSSQANANTKSLIFIIFMLGFCLLQIYNEDVNSQFWLLAIHKSVVEQVVAVEPVKRLDQVLSPVPTHSQRRQQAIVPTSKGTENYESSSLGKGKIIRSPTNTLIEAAIRFHNTIDNRRANPTRQKQQRLDQPKKGRLTTALCHKTIFGPIDLHRLAVWAAYHRLLGFDQIFLWYLPSMTNATGNSPAVGGSWEELESLPFVKLLPNNFGEMKRYEDGYERIERGKRGDQIENERWCLRDYASKFDFVLNADGDEYLWFNEHKSLQEFLKPYRSYTYLSFGKWMYTMKYGVHTNRKSVFGLEEVSALDG